jgi:ABC-type dipeptide/oligopeptide/nickel transport system permease component
MTLYVLRRLALSVGVLFGLAVVTFFMIHLVPGDPVQLALGGRGTPAAVAEVRAQLGLDRPLLTQFGDFLGGTVTGDLGHSVAQNAPVTEIIAGASRPARSSSSTGCSSRS